MRSSIEEVVRTLFEALALVVLVVILFLQTWRASIIPIVAVPVSLVGTFAVMKLLGFSINALSLFGLVLAIGIVVDDAIVVVENVERNIELGLSPREATRKAMDEVSGPIIAIALVLCAVFVPIAFVSGLTGQFLSTIRDHDRDLHGYFRVQFAHLEPGARGRAAPPAVTPDAPKDRLSRWMDVAFWVVFSPLEPVLQPSVVGLRPGRSEAVLRRSRTALVIYAGLLGLTWFGFQRVPTGFVPTQDKQYLIAFAQLPDAASLARSEEVIRKMTDVALETPGVADCIEFPGLSIAGFNNAPNAGVIFVALKTVRRAPQSGSFHTARRSPKPCRASSWR